MPFSRSRSIESMTRSDDLLVGPEGPGLAEHGVDESGLAVVDVGDDRDVAERLLTRQCARGHGIAFRSFSTPGGDERGEPESLLRGQPGAGPARRACSGRAGAPPINRATKAVTRANPMATRRPGITTTISEPTI